MADIGTLVISVPLSFLYSVAADDELDNLPGQRLVLGVFEHVLFFCVVGLFFLLFHVNNCLQ